MSNPVGNCIFHIPNHIDEIGSSGSQVRPRMMLQAFRNIGYSVDAVMGYGAERKEQIAAIKDKIRAGYKYDFLYSESSTMPTLLTEKHHYPTYPNLDFGFISFVKKKNIPIGLFYRDIYWRFPFYGEELPWWQKDAAKLCYLYDLWRYERLLDVLFVPTLYMRKWIANEKLNEMAYELLPGAVFDEKNIAESCAVFKARELRNDGRLHLFYVGGISGQYQFDKLLKVVSELPYVELTICCRDFEWEKEKGFYERYLNDRIRVIHKFGKDLEPYYREADICMLWFQLTEYRVGAMPIKMLEYLSHAKPQIATSGNAQADFIERHKIGWHIPYEESAMKALLERLHRNYAEVVEAHKYSLQAIQQNTWECRAKTARDVLLSCNQ